MDQSRIVFQSELTEQDFKKASYFNAFFRKRIVVILMAVVCLLGITGIIVGNQMFPLPFSVLFAVYPLIFWLLNAGRIRKSVAVRMKSSRKQTIILKEDGIQCLKQDVDELYDWNSVKDFYETKNYFYAYTANKILVMPKRDVDDGQCQDVRNLIINTLSYKNYRLKQ